MCLDIKYPKEEIKKLPKEFTAYKATVKKKGAYYFPLQKTDRTIEAINTLPTMDDWDRTLVDRKTYKPYYHSFRTKTALKKVEEIRPKQFCFIKIKIKRKDVTCIGGQGKNRRSPFYKIIVSRAFTTNLQSSLVILLCRGIAIVKRSQSRAAG